jgi:hypothetical protein
MPNEKKQDAEQAKQHAALEHLKQHQKPRIAGTHHKPFLTDPAEFGSGHTKEELASSQKGQIIAIPKLKRTPPVMDIAEVIGAAQVNEIIQSGQFVFHSAGDTGAGKHDDLGQVVEVMALDFHRPNPADQPAFFFHLGDVVYNTEYSSPQSKSRMYQPQFYEPYENYPGKILAIPGNHDSNPQEDPQSIDAFEANFCAPPPAAGQPLQSSKRDPMYQPGVYYQLDAPFVQILALFSNGGEKEGVIRGDGAGEDQWNFLLAQLKAIKAARAEKRSALIVAMHHPPFSGGGGHTGSSHMLKDLDDAFKQCAIWPDAIFSGHSHLYERFTREVPVNGKTMQIPYMVLGMGGHGITPMKTGFDRKPVRTPLKGKTKSESAGELPDHSLRQYFNGFGHALVTVTSRVLTIDLIGTKTETHEAVDSVTVQLGSDYADNKIIHETAPFEHPANGEEERMHTKKAIA